MTLKHPPIPARFHSLDVIRGVAALVVVVWHWQHFLLGGTGELAFRQTDQPFYAQLSMFYHWGWLAVDFFFSLSGFVFFWLYGEAVATRGVDGWRFFVARFSRLYPLHLVTFT
ncbi:acyltransferase family protein, partial [Stenotrophomonas sp. GbtcB23]|uniref:acyltransferase family protein n=1 Tax=Stenotrophomonas sp. GbtcB23 TaxID=2824768 RepID=UPI001C302A8E